MKTKFLYILALCLLLTACGKQQKTELPDPLAETNAYTAEVTPCKLPMSGVTASCTSGGMMYLGGYTETGDGTGLTFSDSSDDGIFSVGVGIQAVLCRLDPASGQAERLADYAPEAGASIAALVPCADGSIWALEQSTDMSGSAEEVMAGIAAAGGVASGGQVWRHLSADGSQELASVDLASLELGPEGIVSSLVDGEGRLYAASANAVTAVDGAGKTLFTCRSQEGIERLVSLSDGGVGALTSRPEGGRTVFPIDPEARNWGAACPLTGDAVRLYPGDETYRFLYTSGDSLYGWPKDAAAPERLLSWSDTGLDCTKVSAMTFLPDGRGAALLWDRDAWPAAGSTVLLSPVDPEVMANRTVLTLATMGMTSETRAQVLAFNRTSTEYRIEVRDYSEFNTPDDASAGVTKLNTEILAGKMPDLLEVSDALPLRQYAAKGYLESLWPYIESDPRLGRESVMERALQSAELDGALYQVFSTFYLNTLAGASSMVGERSGWTLAELKEALARQEPGFPILDQNETRSSIFESLFSRNLDQFVDWTAGTARFDSQEFREILEFCAAFPDKERAGDDGMDVMTRAAEGGQLLLRSAVLSLTSVKIDRELFGDQVTFVGYPGGEGTPARFQTEGGLAMSSACSHKEGAWELLRRLLLPTGGDFFPGGFPISRADFDRAVEKAMEEEYVRDENGEIQTDENGDPIPLGQSYGFLGGRMIPLNPITQEDYDQAMALYEAAGSLDRRDENIWAIVQECVGPYFAGDKPAEDVMKTIQNRVELYLNEQK